MQKSPVISGAETHFLDRQNFKIFIKYRQLVILTGILYLNFQKISIFGVFGCFSYVLALGEGFFGCFSYILALGEGFLVAFHMFWR